MNRSIERIAFAAIALLSSTSFYASAMVYTPSSGGVSDLGSASYTVPIQAPPGTAGITPKLAISYSSLGLNGVAGIGWSLSGLSVISRCPKSLATDALVGGVRLDINDRFCLDGTRLVVVPTTATYGADGTEYRTEVESLTKVISHGSAGNGPAWFQVWTREGLIYEYGNTADSQTLSVGSSTARLWAVNKVSDLFGNYYTVTYSQDPVNGSFQPTRIDYTGNVAASLAPYNSIQFAYESRLDGEQWYVGSGLVRQTNRLTNVRTYSGTTLVRDYRLAYETSPNTLRSRLTSVTECAGDETTCMPALTENYVVPSGGLSQAGATIATLNAKNPVVPAAPMKQSNLISATVGDFNGDGIQDVLYVLNYAGMSTTPRAVCYGPTFSTCTSQISMNNSSVEYIGDFDGDGITDRLVWQSDGSMGYCPGPALTTCYTFGYGTSSPYWTFVVGDFDGDGRADLLGWDIRGIGGNYGFLCSITSSSGCKSIQGVSGHGYAVQTGDFDGDGATDLLLISASSYTACSQINTGTNVSSPPCQPVNLPFNTSNANIEVGDFNGDGKADLMFLTTSGVFFCPGPGLLHGYNCSQVPGTSGDWKSAFKPFVGDFDADGRSDLLLTGPSGTQFCSGPVFSQNGACVTVSSQDLSASTILVGDFNGDASSDVFAISATGNQFASGISHIPDLLAGVTNTAFNTATTFTYRPITDTTIHTKGASAGYPIENQALPYLDPAHLLRPFYVASQMTVPNGVGSSNATNYRYESAATELDGRGFTGFTVTHATDVARNRETIRTLSQTFPNMHRVEHRQVFAAGQLASTWKQTFGSTRSCDHNLPIATTIDAVDSSYGLDGVMRSEHLAYSSFDCWGHAKVVSHYQSETSSQLKEAQTLTYQMNLFGQPGQWGVFDRLVESINTFYDQSALNPVTQTDTYTYLNNTNFLQEHVIEPNDATFKVVVDFTSDAFGNVTSSTTSGSDIDSRTTSNTFDARGQFATSTTNPLGQSTNQAYDPRFGFVTSVTDANSITTSWAPDLFGRKALETRPDGSQTSWSYGICCTGYSMNPNLAYQIVSLSTGITQPTATYFDVLGRKVMSARRNFEDTDWIDDGNVIYDVTGKVATQYLPYERLASSKPFTSTSYDSLGRIKTSTAPDGGVSSYSYPFTYAVVTDPLGHATTYEHLMRDNLLAVVLDATNHSGRYTYSALNQIATSIDPAGNTSTFTYDKRGRLAAKNDMDLGGWSYTYDRLGQLKTQIDAKGQVTTFTYDKLGRTTSRSEPSMVGTWSWDTAPYGIGKLASTTTSGGVTKSYAYDTLSRLGLQSLTVDGTTLSMATTYDSIGRRASLVYPTGFSINYSYNGPGYLSQISNAATGAMLWRGLSMSPVGYSGEDLGDGVGIETVYDGSQRIAQLAAVRDSDGSVLQNHGVSYDLVGNVSSRNETVQGASESYSYDSLNRLTGVAGPAPKSFTYDVAGNIATKSDVGSYTYGSSDHVHGVTAAGTTNYAYDANGNIHTAGSKSIEWTSFNMPATVQNGSSSYSWAYEANRSRVKYVSPTATTYYFSQAGIDLLELSVIGSLVQAKSFVYVGGRSVAEYINRSDGTSALNFLVSDRLGSISLVLDQSGTPTEHLSYDASGKRRFPSELDDTAGTLSGIATNEGFTDREHLDALGLIHMNGRVYDPRIGRFLSPDQAPPSALMPQGLNLYSYAFNNPFSYVDPSGFCNIPVNEKSACIGAPVTTPEPAPGPYNEDDPGYRPPTTNNTLVPGGGGQDPDVPTTPDPKGPGSNPPPPPAPSFDPTATGVPPVDPNRLAIANQCVSDCINDLANQYLGQSSNTALQSALSTFLLGSGLYGLGQYAEIDIWIAGGEALGFTSAGLTGFLAGTALYCNGLCGSLPHGYYGGSGGGP